jgi:hypothetical protein
MGFGLFSELFEKLNQETKDKGPQYHTQNCNVDTSFILD